MEIAMIKLKKLLVMLAGAAAVALSASSAQAGYIYVPTCVPGYWVAGVYGQIWVPPVCM